MGSCQSRRWPACVAAASVAVVSCIAGCRSTSQTPSAAGAAWTSAVASSASRRGESAMVAASAIPSTTQAPRLKVR